MMRLIAPWILSLIYVLTLGCSSQPVETSDEEVLDLVEASETLSDEPADDLGSAGEELTGEESVEEEMADVEPSSEQDEFAEEQAFEEEASEEVAQQDSGDEFAEEAFAEEEVAQEEAPQDEFAQEESSAESFDESPAEDQAESEIAATPEPELYPTLIEIKDIKYMANQQGGTIVIDADEAVSYSLRSKPETHQFVIEIDNVSLPERLKRPFIMKEFDAAFASINAYQNPGSSVARIVVQMKGDKYGEPVLQLEGNSLVMVPAPSLSESLKQAEAKVTPVGKQQEPDTDSEQIDVGRVEADEKVLGARSLDEFLSGMGRFYGRPISIEVTDNDIREVLKFIAEESGLNMVINEDVQGKITIKLRKIPWDQALVTIMRAKNLGYVRQGNVVRIATLGSLQAENEAAKKIIESQKTVQPLRVRVIPVSYARVEDLQNQIKPFLSKERGQVTVDPRTSSLILTDTEETLEKINRLVKELDIPPAQVMIEGKVVEANESFSQTLGLNWGFSGGSRVISPGGGAGGTDLTLEPGLSFTNLPQEMLGSGTSPLAASLRIGQFDLLGDISAFLNLAESESLVKVLSSPRVVTINKERAQIEQQGQAISVTTVRDVTGLITRSPVRDTFSLNLGVTPQITADGSVIMDVEVKRQFAGAIEEVTTGARPINTRTAKTKVLVKDGQTAVIGGIYSSDETTQESGVPWLRKIPMFGWLFKARARRDQRNELLIFLTPKILNIQDQAVEG